MKMIKLFKRQEGVSLLEAMLFLVIAGLVLMMSLRYFTQSNEGQRINNAYDQHMGMLSAQTAYVGDGNSINNSDLVSGTGGELITNNYLSSDFQTDPWGGTNTMTVTNGIPQIVSTQIPTGSCNKLASRINTTIIGADAQCASGTLTAKYNADVTSTNP